jgi:hypothetical protein
MTAGCGVEEGWDAVGDDGGTRMMMLCPAEEGRYAVGVKRYVGDDNDGMRELMTAVWGVEEGRCARGDDGDMRRGMLCAVAEGRDAVEVKRDVGDDKTVCEGR